MDPVNRTGNALQGNHPRRPQNPPILAAAGHPGGDLQIYSYGIAGGYYTPAVPNQNLTPVYLHHSPYEANTMGFGQTITNQSLNPQMQNGLVIGPTAANTASQAMPNQGCNSHLPQLGGPAQTSLGKNNVVRHPLLPTPTQTITNKSLSSQPTMKASASSSRIIIGESLRLKSDKKKKKSRDRNRKRRKALLPTSNPQINAVPSSSEFVGTCPIMDGRQLEQAVLAPDGTTNKKYPAPDLKNLLFDSSTGYRFDPTTGLHYDANSGIYLNNRLKLLLRWNPMSSTYVLVSSNTSGLAKPAVELMNQSHGRTSGPLEPNTLLNHGRYDPGPYRSPDRYDVSLHRDRSPTSEPDLYLSSYESSLELSDDECEPYSYETLYHRGRSPDFYPSDAKRYRQSSPEMRIPVGDLREYLRRDQAQGYYPSSSDGYDVRDRVRDDGRRELGSRSSPRRSRSPPRRRSRTPPRRRRRSRTPPRRRRSRNHSRDCEIMKIQEQNLKDARNLHGRHFPKFESPTSYILVAPMPPKYDCRTASVIKQVENMIALDGLTSQEVSVVQEGYGAPCSYALVQFDNPDDALRWYLSHKGTIELGNWRTQYTTFMFFSTDHWLCSKRHDTDTGCDPSTPNFPFRTICYRCFQLRSKLESPINKSETPTKWIGLSHCDSIKYSSISDVMTILPEHKGISIESAEFVRESSGLPIGLSVFQMPGTDQASKFFQILKKKALHVCYVNFNKKALDSAPTLSHSVHNEKELVKIRLRQRDDIKPRSSNGNTQSETLKKKNNYNPPEFDFSAKGARFFVIKSYSEDDIQRSIKYEIWCSTEHGNKRLDQAFHERESKPNGGVYLFFSVNGSGNFCGMARMTSAVDYNASSSVWSLDKWKGQFRVRWIYVKDVPNGQLRHIRLENNENKPVTNSRDTQEVPFERGKQVFRIIHSYRHTSSIFDNIIHYERRQEEEDNKKEAHAVDAVNHPPHHHHKVSVLLSISPSSKANLCQKAEAARQRRGGDPDDRRIYSALPSSKRRRRPHKSVNKPLAAESFFEALDEEFVVIDECKDESDDDRNKSGPFLKRPINQVIKEQLKNVISLHQKNSEDPDNVLSNLLNDDPSLKAFVLLAPVPANKEALVKMELESILTSDGDDFIDFGIFQGKGLGAPCHYGLVQFYKPVNALNWYNQHEALLHLNLANDQVKAFMFFSHNNWTCLHCRFTNFPLRNWCNRCFKNKNQNVFSPVSESRTPTKFLGISSSGLPHNMTETSFTTENILANLPEESKQLVSCKFILEDKDLPGLCVIEAKDPKECENLRKHLLSKGWRTSFLQMHKEPSDGSGMTHDSDNTPKTDRSVVAQPGQKNRPVVNNVERKYDSLKHIFDNSKTSQCIIMSPTPNIKWLVVKEHLDNLLERDGLNSHCSYVVCRPEVYGAPQDYIQIRFFDLEVAESWYEKHKGVVEFAFPETPVRKELKFQMNMYYSQIAWPCRACSTLNFPARSLCHKCYAHKDEKGFTPVAMSSTPTKWVGISCLRETIYTVDQVKKSLPPLDGFQIVRMLFIKELNPLLHVGLCVIETPSEEDGRVLAEYIQKHPALKYNNEKKAKIIFINLNERLGEEGSEQTSSADDLAVLCSSSDGTFSPNDSADNFSHWWKHLQNGVAGGEDILENLFQDQYVVPLPSGDSVLVPLPPSQLVFSQDCTVNFNRALYVPLLEKAGVGIEMAGNAKLYHGKAVGSPCAYTILKFKTASEATAWRAKHDDKWIIQLRNGSPWPSFLHPCDPNWKCGKCNNLNFPLRLHCFCCYNHRFGGAPIVTLSDTPTKFVGITKFQNWCASEEILFDNIKVLSKMKENQQLKEVHFLTEPSGISLGLCILELENTETSRFIFTHLIGLTQRRQNVVYMEINSLNA